MKFLAATAVLITIPVTAALNATSTPTREPKPAVVQPYPTNIICNQDEVLWGDNRPEDVPRCAVV